VPDAADLSMVASSALPATFAFLYQRLNGLLDRRRSGRPAEPDQLSEVPPQLVGTLSLPLVADPDLLAGRSDALEALALGMAYYQRDPSLVTSSDELLLQTLGRVRQALEEIYGQRFTFEGETRAASGPISELCIETVVGNVVAMEAEETISGAVTARVHSATVEAGATVTGMKAKNIDGRR
jgi:hypothetical protein